MQGIRVSAKAVHGHEWSVSMRARSLTADERTGIRLPAGEGSFPRPQHPAYAAVASSAQLQARGLYARKYGRHNVYAMLARRRNFVRTFTRSLAAEASSASDEDGGLILKNDLAGGFVLRLDDAGDGGRFAFIEYLEDAAR